MKVHIWKEQQDFFEIAILEQSTELVPMSLADLATGGSRDPIVIVGKALSSERVSSFRQIITNVFKAGTALLLVPPFGDFDLSFYIDIATPIRIIRQPATSECTIKNKNLLPHIGPQLKIRSDHFIDTALAAGVVCVNRDGKTTLLRFQPKNTAGALFISTLQLLSYTALTDESNRIDLLSAVLKWKKNSSAQAFVPDESGDEPQPPRKEDISSVLLALSVMQLVESDKVHKIMRNYLGTNLSDDALRDAIDYLKKEGVLQSSHERPYLKVVTHRLTEVIEALQLHAYARELKELSQNSAEVWI